MFPCFGFEVFFFSFLLSNVVAVAVGVVVAYFLKNGLSNLNDGILWPNVLYIMVDTRTLHLIRPLIV